MTELNELMNRKGREILARFANLIDYFRMTMEFQSNCCADL